MKQFDSEMKQMLYNFRQLNLSPEKEGVIFPLSDYWPII